MGRGFKPNHCCKCWLAYAQSLRPYIARALGLTVEEIWPADGSETVGGVAVAR
ncbi:MAG: hypothetical protein ACPLPT_08025 [Moorellales bacterium]